MSHTSVHDTGGALPGPGHHAHPWQGSRLAELVAALPGGRWTDHPTGADPMLAALARAVNDGCADEGRWTCWRCCPGCPGRFPAPPHRPGRGSWARPGGGASPWPTPRWPRDWPGSVRALSRCDDADQRLWWLLHDAINLTRAADGLPALPDRADMRLPDRWPHRLPVRVHIRVPDGAQSTYYHCTPVWEGWPARLQHDWAAREAELRLLTDVDPPRPAG
ncbi:MULTISPECIES: hypothetical protein [Micromonospora]|uniref:hypothetical protein n=1 Tax=Micromonospora TaxID=1873 RepID=UPI001EF7F722|nr:MULTISPECIES: hypothetical protein [Micromonospora]